VSITQPRGVPHFRSLRSCTQTERHRAVAHAALASEVAHVLERKVRFPPVTIRPAALSDNPTRDEIEAAATTTRQCFDLAAGPVPNVVRLLELGGAIVTRHSLDTGRVDAFACDFTTRPVVVLGTDKDDRARSRFDAAHELGHLVLHQEATPGASELERQADIFAAAFLMPASDIASDFPTRVSWARLLGLKHVWGISLAALLFRGRTLGLLSETAYRRSMVTMSQRGWRTNEPGQLGAAETPTALRRALELLEPTGYGVDSLANDINLSIDTVELIIGVDERPTLHVPTAVELTEARR
jgi:Zn-dependent peptidase ImmA (M78 family)